MVTRVIAGHHPDTGVVGLWISKPGKDARTETDPDSFLFEPSKYLSRPYAKFTTTVFQRGAFVNTSSFTDGSKADNYIWTANFVHALGFVPVFVVQLGGDIREPWADGAVINIQTAAMAPYRYNVGSPGTPIAGTILNNTVFVYDLATDTVTYVAGNPSTFSVYRTPLF